MRVRRLADGTIVEVLTDGSTRALPPDKTDWDSLRRMTDEEIDAAAAADPDTPRRENLKPVPRARSLRRALRLTQEEFSAQFRIPLGTLRDWEQGKSKPDQAARAYLHVIASNPDMVRKALQSPRLSEAAE